MSRWLLLGLIALPLVAMGTSADAPRDRDRDGLPDRWERAHRLSTSKKSANGDPDRDGLRNRREFRLRTNPRKKDTDGDGYGDQAEVRAGTYPRSRRSHPSAPAPTSPPPARSSPGFPGESN